MNRLFTIVGSTAVAGLVVCVPPVQAQPELMRVSHGEPWRIARAASGHIEGVIRDDRGLPLVGVTVSALGAASAIATTDRAGAFVLRGLPAGAYLLRASRTGFISSRRQFVEVRPSTAARVAVTLQRVARYAPDETPRIMAAGSTAASDPFSGDDASTIADNSEKAWRLRHLPRGPLKNTAERAAIDGGNAESPNDTWQRHTAAAIGRAMEHSARFLTELPVSGQINFLTSSSVDATALPVSSVPAVRGTAHFSIGGPAWGSADWSARFLTQPERGSWFLAASFRNRQPSRHLYDIGFSYSTQRFADQTLWSWARPEVGGRAAGSVFGSGRLLLSPGIVLDYGARYARYNYLPDISLFSPSVSVTITPVRGLRVRTAVSRRMLAPGAEEFLEPSMATLWIPPERTFVGGTRLVPERTHHFEVGLEQDLARGLVVVLRTFYQDTIDQQTALFSGVPFLPETHYAVGAAGDLTARGWSVGVTHTLLSRLRGSVAYQITDAQWLSRPTRDDRTLLVGVEPRSATERLHDLTTSMETELPLTATRVFLACRLNTGFGRHMEDGTESRLSSRFDFQVVQRLPFLDFTSARWQVLFAVKNIFRDAAPDSSVYDELLVIRPPTRFMGGVLVRF